MMDFLRGLAPRPASDSTRAAAVLPSRFVIGGPLGGPLGEFHRPVSADGDTSWLIPGDPRAHGAAHSAGEFTARPQRKAAVTIDAAAVTRDVADPPSPADASARIAWRVTPDSEVHAAPWKPSSPIGIEADGPPGVVAQPALADRVEPVEPPATSVAAPLSDAALRARAGSTADRRPIIHVTIDRIDVRAPAPPPVAQPAPRSRVTSPRVSLADYLRGETGRAGGTR